METWRRKRGPDTRDNQHVREQRDTLRCDAGGNFRRRQRGPAPYMHRFKLDIGGADAGAGGMATSSGSGGAGASGIGASSASTDSSAVARPQGFRGPALVWCASRTTRQWRDHRPCGIRRRRGRARDANQSPTPALCRRGP